ncbi:MAG: DUF4249 family protein [Bacteroidales bacterium]|nr:DUF4249 family protein [Bacteroidales bacterium]
MMLALALVVASCSTDVDLYAEPKDIPIVYGVLNSDADTNFIKITHALYASDDPLQTALNPAESNYPGKLDVRLTEYINGDSVRQIILDTITLHNKPSGYFYAPDQKMYYTTEPLGHNTANELYGYRLTVVLPNRVLSAYTDMVGSSAFRIQSLGVNFSPEYFGVSQSFLFHPAVNASIYDFDLAFTFKEQRTPDSDSIQRTMKWHIGTYYEQDLVHHVVHDMYNFKYRPENFWYHLEEFIGGDTCIQGLTRMLSDQAALVIITAGSRTLQDYMLYSNVVSQEHPSDYAFSNIEGAIGVFASKMTRSQHVGLGGTTMPRLIADPRWGFKFSGGVDP